MQRYEHGGDIYGERTVICDFSVNTNPLGMPDAVRTALARGIPDFARYPDTECRRLREALHLRYGVPVPQILCGNGAIDLIFRICSCLKPHTALTLAPTFSEYERSVRLFGGTVREHRLSAVNDFAVTDRILEDLNGDIDLLFLCNPNNPTGRLIPAALLERILTVCREKHIVTVIDECFLEFTDGRSMIGDLGRFPDLLILKAFTKLYAMAGLRLGFLFGSRELIGRIEPYGPEWSVSVPAQLAGAAALSAEPAWSEKTAAFVRTERPRMTKELQALGIRVLPADGNFLLLQSPVPVVSALKEKGILVRDCRNFTGLDESYFRIGLKTEKQNALLLQALKEELNG